MEMRICSFRMVSFVCFSFFGGLTPTYPDDREITNYLHYHTVPSTNIIVPKKNLGISLGPPRTTALFELFLQ